ncbi:MAG: hypothetical protein HFJ34_02295 [Clostridia bacterium]|nr:hypothetical protein [Clostridia bacterium]
MTKKIKKLVIIIIVTLTIININVVCYKIYGANGAATSATGGVGDVIKNVIDSTKENPTVNPDYYDPVNYDQAQNAGKLANIGNEIIGFLQIIGMIVSVAVLAILGIKYMMGSVEEKAEYKKTMQPYLIGAIMVFSITSILGFIAPLAKTLFYE